MTDAEIEHYFKYGAEYPNVKCDDCNGVKTPNN
jgi:hypothetical protein